MSIFLEPSIPHLREIELAFDDAELVLDFGPASMMVPREIFRPFS